jgi:hypothetical protein
MDFLEKLYKLANNFCTTAQVLAPGTSEFDNMKVDNSGSMDNYTKMINDADFFKFQVENAILNKKVEPRPGWNKPGAKVLEAMTAILNKKPLDNNLKEWAKLEIKSMYNVFTEAQQNEFAKMVDDYSKLFL